MTASPGFVVLPGLVVEVPLVELFPEPGFFSLESLSDHVAHNVALPVDHGAVPVDSPQPFVVSKALKSSLFLYSLLVSSRHTSKKSLD